jgi:hypothetical protein
MARTTVIALLALFAGVLAAPARQEAQAEPKRMPGNDEWYRPAQGFESAPLGTILKYRETKGVSLDNKKSVKLAGSWQFLFRTQDSVGTPEATVVSVAVPFNADKSKLFLYHWFAVSEILGFGVVLICGRTRRSRSKWRILRDDLTGVVAIRRWPCSRARARTTSTRSSSRRC